MARKRKHNLHVREEIDLDNEVQHPEETIDSFLRDVHQETVVSVGEPRFSEENVVVGVGQGSELPGSELPGSDSSEPKVPSLKFLKEHFQTKSAAIRYLDSLNIPTKTIAKHLSIRYQHVRNVLKTDLKRGPNESFHLGTDTNQAVKAIQDGND